MASAIRTTITDIRKAHERLKPYIHHTPVFTSSTFDKLIGRKAFFKAENLQKTGSFKARGALNSVLLLKEKNPALPGVVTHSSGNHGQGLAWAAKTAGVKCCVVIPNNAPKSKADAIKGYGAELRETCARMAKEKGLEIVPPYDHYNVIAGQVLIITINLQIIGTLALELMEQVPELDAILVPISGGGMISGIAIAAKSVKDDVKGKRLWPNPPRFLSTIADGIRLQQLGHLTFPIMLDLVEKEVFTIACPFQLDVYTEDCDDAELDVVRVDSYPTYPGDLSFDDIISKSFIKHGEISRVKGMKDLCMYTYTNDGWATLVLDNKSHTRVRVELDCSRSENVTSNHDSLQRTLRVDPGSTVIAYHLMPEDDDRDWQVKCTETIR
ncbi:SRR [Mytilus edulis]|uniref:L-serine ammonia-lyase n=1 Tax=Mytilus edulis TaxID=6550 RepID=A0A8S3QQ52_MYTED|nr:SRR [Mytilus edulis]